MSYTEQTVRWFLRVGRWIRVPELMLLSGPTVLAYIMGRGLDPHLIVFYGGVFCLGARIMLLNTLMGERIYHEDRGGQDFPLDEDDWVPDQMWRLSHFLLVLYLFFFLSLSIWTLFLAVLIELLWWVYIHPQILCKGKPGLDTLLHFLAGMIQFGLGWSPASRWPHLEEWSWMVIVGLSFAAGHIHHTLKDVDIDRRAGIMTIGQWLGFRRGVLAGNGLFLGAYALMMLTAFCYTRDDVRLVLHGVITGAFLIQAIAFMCYARSMMKGRTMAIRLYRRVYRLVFLVIGCTLAYVHLSISK